MDEHEENILTKLTHDLRNQLAAIYSSAEILGLTLGNKGLEEEQRMAQSILASAGDMNTLLTKAEKEVRS